MNRIAFSGISKFAVSLWTCLTGTESLWRYFKTQILAISGTELWALSEDFYRSEAQFYSLLLCYQMSWMFYQYKNPLVSYKVNKIPHVLWTLPLAWTRRVLGFEDVLLSFDAMDLAEGRNSYHKLLMRSIVVENISFKLHIWICD